MPLRVGRFDVDLMVRCRACGCPVLNHKDLEGGDEEDGVIIDAAAAETCRCSDEHFISVAVDTFSVKLQEVAIEKARDRFKVLNGGKTLTSGEPDSKDS